MSNVAGTQKRVDILWPGVLLLASLLTVGWSGIGERHGRSWMRWLFRQRPRGIVIHHTASDGMRNGELLNAAMIDADHAAKGWGIEYEGRTYHIAYHYVIRADGKVEPGRPELAPGAHTRGHSDYIGICLVGNFSSSANSYGQMQPDRPTAEQMVSLENLLRDLMRRYDLTVHNIFRHRDLAPTSCPGDRFPFEQLIRDLANE